MIFRKTTKYHMTQSQVIEFKLRQSTLISSNIIQHFQPTHFSSRRREISIHQTFSHHQTPHSTFVPPFFHIFSTFFHIFSTFFHIFSTFFHIFPHFFHIFSSIFPHKMLPFFAAWGATAIPSWSSCPPWSCASWRSRARQGITEFLPAFHGGNEGMIQNFIGWFGWMIQNFIGWFGFLKKMI